MHPLLDPADVGRVPHARTARRLHWEHLPPAVRREVERRLGSPVASATSQDSGFTPGFASRLVGARRSACCSSRPRTARPSGPSPRRTPRRPRCAQVPAAGAAPRSRAAVDAGGPRGLDARRVRRRRGASAAPAVGAGRPRCVPGRAGDDRRDRDRPCAARAAAAAPRPAHLRHGMGPRPRGRRRLAPPGGAARPGARVRRPARRRLVRPPRRARRQLHRPRRRHRRPVRLELARPRPALGRRGPPPRVRSTATGWT